MPLNKETLAGGMKGFNSFAKGISLKVNIMLLEFEVAVQHFSRYAMGTSLTD